MRTARPGMAASSVVVMAAFVVSKLVGLLRDRAIAGAFGAGPETDAYYAALRIPDALFTLVAGGALVSAFLPVFAEALAGGDRDRAWRLCGAVTNLALVVTAVLAAVTALLADGILARVAPGFPQETRALSVDLMRILLAGTVIFSVSGLQMGILNAFHRFALAAVAPAVYNAGLLFGAAALSGRFGIRGVAYGALIGALGHLLVKVPGLVACGYRYVPTLGVRDPAVWHVVRLMGPRMLGLATVQAVWLVTVRLASPLAAGSLAAYQFGWALAQVPQTLLGTAVGIVAFPTLADLAARREAEGLRDTVATALRAMLATAVPAAVALAALAGAVVQLVLVTGAFDEAAAAATRATLVMLSVGLVGHVLLELLARAFYAAQDTVRPLYFGALAMVLNIALAWWLVAPLGVAGLALANSLAVSAEVAVAYEVLRRRLGGLRTAATARCLVQVLAASAVMLAVLLATQHAWPPSGAPSLAGGLVRLGVAAALGGAAYLTAAWILRIPEAREAAGMVARLTRRRGRL